MSKFDLIAKTLEDALKHSDRIRREWKFDDDDPAQPWYRGHQRKHWRLVPTVVRYGCFDRRTEDEIREEFVLRAPALAGNQPMPTSDWDFYFLMQHFGAPTRLIDWTENLLVALHFAVRDNPGHYDSAVWMLNPYELNRKVIGKGEILAPSAQGVNPRGTKLALPWLPTRWKQTAIPKDPIALHPTHIATRISNQKSCFTIHGVREDGFARFYSPTGDASCLARIVIPSYAVVGLKLALQRYGIDDATIFPDLAGLGRLCTSSASTA